MNKAPVVFLPPRLASSLTGSDWRLGGAGWESCSCLLPSAGTPLHRFRAGFTWVLRNGNHPDRKCGPESVSAFSKKNEMRRWQTDVGPGELSHHGGLCKDITISNIKTRDFSVQVCFVWGEHSSVFYFILLYFLLFYFISLDHCLTG